jgi:PAS domain S-box-containing protein
MHAITKKELEIIFNSTHDGMIAINGEGAVTFFNRSAEQITGLKAEEVMGDPADEVIPNTRLHIALSEGKAEVNQQQNICSTVIVTNGVPVQDDFILLGRNYESRI